MFDQLKRISIYTVITAITSAISLLLLPVITKFLTPSDYGILSIFNASIRFLVSILSIGSINVLMIKLVQDKEKFGSYFKSFLSISFTSTILLTIIAFIYIQTGNTFFGLPNYFTLLLPLFSFIVLWDETITSIFIFLKKIKVYSIYKMLKFGVEVVLIILLIVIFPFSWKGRIAALILSIILLSFYAIKYLKTSSLIKGNIRFPQIKYLVKKGSPLIFMNISITVISLSDRYFIKYFEGITQTGLYGIASTIAGILLIFIGASMNVFRPSIYEKLNNNELNKKTFFLMIFYYTFLLLSGAVILYFLTPFLFKNLINRQYFSALPYVAPLIIGLIFWGLYNLFVSILLHQHRMKTVGIISFIGISSNLVLNYFLIQNFGTIGAAYATLFSYLVILILITIVGLNIYGKNNVK